MTYFMEMTPPTNAKVGLNTMAYTKDELGKNKLIKIAKEAPKQAPGRILGNNTPKHSPTVAAPMVST
jgi:hypothetical protein